MRYKLHLLNIEPSNIVLLWFQTGRFGIGQVWVIKGRILVKTDADFKQLKITPLI